MKLGLPPNLKSTIFAELPASNRVTFPKTTSYLLGAGNVHLGFLFGGPARAGESAAWWQVTRCLRIQARAVHFPSPNPEIAKVKKPVGIPETRKALETDWFLRWRWAICKAPWGRGCHHTHTHKHMKYMPCAARITLY